jgi:hypothetical protein
VHLQIRISLTGTNNGTFQAAVTGANLNGIRNPVTVTVVIRDNTGDSGQITATLS